jgi:undecaprenyl-diphosphatase
MTWLQAVVLGIVQGLGEFLPISSSGHLIVAPWLLGFPPQDLAFDLALHLGTLAAVVYAFIGDWVKIVRDGVSGLLKGQPFATSESRTLWLLGAASVPGAVAGLVLDDWAETTFRNPLLVAVTMSVMGTVLWLADRRAGQGADDEVTVRDAMLIGLAQALALVPGVSRSGATISTALFLGYKRERAARFSFLLATPITFGAAVYKVPDLLRSNVDVTLVAIGMLTAAVFGFLSIRVLLAYVRTRDYRPFVFYRYAFSLMILVVAISRGMLW